MLVSIVRFINKNLFNEFIKYLFYAFEQSKIGVAVAGPDYLIINENYEFSKLIRKNNLIGKKIKTLFKDGLEDKYDTMIKNINENGFWECNTELIINKEKRIQIILSFTELKDILKNSSHILIVVKNITKFKQKEKELKKSQELLKVKNKELEDNNTALKEILVQVELEKRKMQNNVKENITIMIMPILTNLKILCEDDENKVSHIESIEKSLLNINSYEHCIFDYEKLSPREIEICNMIKKNLSNKEIANILNISILTVERHRHNIRKKLGIAKKKMNLHSYLDKE